MSITATTAVNDARAMYTVTFPYMAPQCVRHRTTKYSKMKITKRKIMCVMSGIPNFVNVWALAVNMFLSIFEIIEKKYSLYDNFSGCV